MGLQAARNVGDIYSITGIQPSLIAGFAGYDPGLHSSLLGPRNAAGEIIAPGWYDLKLPDPEPFEEPKPAPAAEEGAPTALPAVAAAIKGATDQPVGKDALAKLPEDLISKPEDAIAAIMGGVPLARAYVASGHSMDILPVHIQRVLEHAEAAGTIPPIGALARLDEGITKGNPDFAGLPPPGEPPKLPPPPPPGGEPPLLEGPGPGEGPMKLTYAQAEQSVLDAVAPDAAKSGWPEWMNPHMWAKAFQSRLTPASSIKANVGLDPGAMTIEDHLRQGAYGSLTRAQTPIMHNTILPDTKNNQPWVMLKTSNASIFGALKQAMASGGTLKGLTAYMMAGRTIEKSLQTLAPDVRSEIMNYMERGRSFKAATEKAIRDAVEMGDKVESGKKPITTPVDLNAALTMWQSGEGHAKYAEAAKTLRQVHDATMDYAVARGLLTPAQAAGAKAANRFYTTMRRMVDPTYNPYKPGQYGGLWGFKGAPKIMEGSDALLVDPWTATIDNLKWIMTTADQAEGVRRALGLMKSLPEGQQWAVKKAEISNVPSTERDETLYVDVGKELGGSIPKETQDFADAMVRLRQSVNRLGPDDFVNYPGDGRVEIWTAKNKEMAQLLTFQNLTTPEVAGQMLNAVARLSRTGIMANLGYAVRETWHATLGQAVATGHGMVPFEPVIRGFMSVWNKDEAYQSALAHGAFSSYLGVDAMNNYMATYRDFEAAGIFDKAMNVIKHPIDALMAVNDFTRQAATVGTFKHLVQNKQYDFGKAATLTRTARLDFAEQATARFVRRWQQSVPFMTVGIKGLEQIGRAMKEDPVGFMARGFTWITAPSLILSALNAWADQDLPDNQKYSEIPAAMRAAFWITPQIGGHRLWMPKPFGIGYLFGTVPQQIAENLFTGAQLKPEDILTSVQHQILPPYMPSLLSPVVEEFANRSLYSGRPLIPDRLAQRSGYMQYTPYTSEPAKAIARMIGPTRMDIGNISPITIDNYVQQWGGPLGMEVARLASAPWRPPGKPTDISDLPIVGSFLRRNPSYTDSMDRFYEAATEVEATHADLKAAIQTGDSSQITDAVSLQYFGAIAPLKKAMDQITTTINTIDRSSIPDDDKLSLEDSLTARAVAIAEQGLKAMAMAKQAQPIMGLQSDAGGLRSQ